MFKKKDLPPSQKWQEKSASGEIAIIAKKFRKEHKIYGRLIGKIIPSIVPTWSSNLNPNNGLPLQWGKYYYFLNKNQNINIFEPPRKEGRRLPCSMLQKKVSPTWATPLWNLKSGPDYHCQIIPFQLKSPFFILHEMHWEFLKFTEIF